VFFDDNGLKGGGICCAFMVRLLYCFVLRVEHMVEMSWFVFDGGFGALEWLFECYCEWECDSF